MSIPQTPSPLANILASKSYNAAWFPGATFEEQIQNAYNAAVTDGASFVVIPANMEGYNPALVNATGTVQFVTETKLMNAGIGKLTVLDVTGFNGATAGDKIIAALVKNSAGSGNTPIVLDMRRFTGVQIIDKNIVDQAIFAYSKQPVVWLWGSAEYWFKVQQKALTNHLHILDGATLIFGKNADGTRNIHQYGFQSLGNGTQVATVVGSGTVTLFGTQAANAAGNIVPGHGIAIFGHVPRGGKDNTTIGADPGAAGVSIQVASTTGFPASGYLAIPNNAATDFEIVQYTSVDATHFLGCTRGYAGTGAVVHNVGVAVNRAVYETYIVQSIAGNVITLDEGRTVPFTASSMDMFIGAYRFVITGHGILDGNMDVSTDDTFNPVGVYTLYARHNYFGPGLTFRNWDHSGVALQACQDCEIYSRVVDSTRPSLQLGSATWLFGNCKRNVVEIEVENTYIGCYIDSRTITPQIWDGPSDNNRVVIKTARNVVNPIRESGGRGNYCHVQSAVGIPATGQGIDEDGDSQWITSANAQGYTQNNVFVADALEGTVGFNAIVFSANWGDTNTVVSRTRGVPLSAPANTNTGITVEGPGGYFTLTDAATIAVNAVKGETMEVTLGGNRIMGAPTNLYKGKYLRFVITQDGTGGRTLAWNAVYKTTWSDVGNTLNKRSTMTFYCYDGTNLVQVGAQGPYV